MQYIPFDKQDRAQLHEYIESSYEMDELTEQVESWEINPSADPMLVCILLEAELGYPLAFGPGAKL